MRYTNEMRFVDTNVLLYAISRHPDEGRKQQIAASILNDDDLALSVQVLQEFYAQATRATRRDALAHEQACRLIEAWMRYPVCPITVSIMNAALDTRRRWGIAYWDATIIEAARESKCSVVLSEDLQDGMDYNGVRVANPFV